MAVDRLALLYGPYAAPVVKRGDALPCERLGRDIEIGGLSDAPIQWPYALKTGRRSLILCGDLVRAVQVESEIAIAHWWGVGLTTVWAWRKALGIGRTTSGTSRLHRDYKPAKLTDEATARGRSKALTPEAIAKNAEKHRGKPSPPQTRAALLAAVKGRKQSPDHIRSRVESYKATVRGRRESTGAEKPMPAVPPSQVRIPEATKAKIADLAAKWGGLSPANRTAVIIEAINRAHAAEFGGPKITRAKPKAAKS